MRGRNLARHSMVVTADLLVKSVTDLSSKLEGADNMTILNQLKILIHILYFYTKFIFYVENVKCNHIKALHYFSSTFLNEVITFLG